MRLFCSISFCLFLAAAAFGQLQWKLHQTPTSSTISHFASTDSFIYAYSSVMETMYRSTKESYKWETYPTNPPQSVSTFKVYGDSMYYSNSDYIYLSHIDSNDWKVAFWAWNFSNVADFIVAGGEIFVSAGRDFFIYKGSPNFIDPVHTVSGNDERKIVKNGDRIYWFGKRDFSVSFDDGQTWTTNQLQLLSNDFFYENDSAQYIISIQDSSIYQSKDYFAHWDTLSLNMPVANSYAFFVRQDTIFAGHKQGHSFTEYLSSDWGKTWVNRADSNPNLPIHLASQAATVVNPDNGDWYLSGLPNNYFIERSDNYRLHYVTDIGNGFYNSFFSENYIWVAIFNSIFRAPKSNPEHWTCFDGTSIPIDGDCSGNIVGALNFNFRTIGKTAIIIDFKTQTYRASTDEGATWRTYTPEELGLPHFGVNIFGKDNFWYFSFEDGFFRLKPSLEPAENMNHILPIPLKNIQSLSYNINYLYIRSDDETYVVNIENGTWLKAPDFGCTSPAQNGFTSFLIAESEGNELWGCLAYKGPYYIKTKSGQVFDMMPQDFVTGAQINTDVSLSNFFQMNDRLWMVPYGDSALYLAQAELSQFQKIIDLPVSVYGAIEYDGQRMYLPGTTQGIFELSPISLIEDKDEKKQCHQLNIFPNPASDLIWLQKTKPTREYIADIKIFNASGKLVKTLNQEFVFLSTIDISDLPSGVYFLHVLLGSDCFVEHFIKR